MKRAFHLRTPPGPFDDPFLFLRFFHTGRAILFDLGDLAPLSSRDLMRVTDVFVTHTHMDHFIGFDRLLRTHLPRSRTLRFYGPEGFLENVRGKLAAYTWNLTGGYPLSIRAFETDGTSVRTAVFSSRAGFEREEGQVRPWDGVFLEEPGFRVRAQVLDHGVPCLGFRLEQKVTVRILSGELERRGLVPGGWIAVLKSAVAGEARSSGKIKAKTRDGFQEMPLGDLRGICTLAEGAALTYVVDAARGPGNLEKIAALAQNSDLLYIEAPFLFEDASHARERKHLTAADAGTVASRAGVKRAVLIHLSPRCEGREGLVVKEAAEAAGRGCFVEGGWRR